MTEHIDCTEFSLSAEDELDIVELGERVWDLSDRVDVAMFFTEPELRPFYFAMAMCQWVRNVTVDRGNPYPEKWKPSGKVPTMAGR